MILIGTSGYSYEDWRGFFYPESMTKEEYLEYYASHFEAVELNFTYYRMPTVGQIESMLKKTNGKVTFSVKANRNMTHERIASEADIREFNKALAPLVEAGKLGATLTQFPHSFGQTESNRKYLVELCGKLAAPVVEFRDERWSEQPILDWLKKIGVGFCCVDEPSLEGLMPPVHVATSDVSYVRFHGQNARKWYNHNQPHERYDYRYTESELGRWVPKIVALDKQSERTMVFFNNHFEAKAVDSARKLAGLLSKALGERRS